MSGLVKCEKCNAEIADDAETCPKCGGETSYSKFNSYILIIIIIAAVWYFDLINKFLNFIDKY